MPKIKVHEKALAHLSRGLYRSPASALRELVSNAWDANATRIRFNTNYPNFYQLSVEDNGDGFSKEDFAELMEGGIGNSDKPSQATIPKYGRPLIGRLGIGLLGIAQICGSFKIISKPKQGTGFAAIVYLYDLLKEKLDQDDNTIVHKDIATKEVDIGEYEFVDFDPNDWNRGTIIATEDIHPTFINSFQESVKLSQFKDPPLEWSKALKIASKAWSLQELGDYWRLLWELSAASPVPYISGNALPKNIISHEQERLLSYNFNVIIDGIKLFKPVYLKGNPGGYTFHKIENIEKNIYGKTLRYHGYIIVQEGLQLKPDELRGIMIRIKNVAIGYYDQTMLDYRTNQGPRSRWLTGEVFVDEGLDNALNIDRDSFNRFHPEYRAIQKYIHDILENKIFPDVYRQIDIRSAKRTKNREKTRNTHLRDTISKHTKKPVKIKITPKSKEPDQRRPVSLEIDTKQIKVSIPEQEDIETKRPYKQLAASVLAIFEIAMQEKTKEKQRERFANLLLDLLSKW